MHQSFKMATKTTKALITDLLLLSVTCYKSALQHVTNSITDTVLELLQSLAKILSTQMS